VLATDVFDRFLADNDLLESSLANEDDAALLRRFQAAPFPAEVMHDLGTFLHEVRVPLAVRSSSLLEDSQYQPFTGVYETFMLPNHQPSARERLERLVDAIKRVYASTFSRHAKAYLRATPYRLEEEKMAVIVQEVVGDRHEERFYPDFSGVARSHNFYPTAPMKSEDGVAAVALGLGRSVVAGEKSLSFCPRYPRYILQFSTVEDILANSQREFWALEVGTPGDPGDPEAGLRETRFALEVAERDATLHAIGSTYDLQNHAVYDGLSRQGIRLVSFAPVLKHGVFPLAEILAALLDTGTRAMNRPAEIEFAVRLGRGGAPSEFGFLQMRPLVLSREDQELTPETVPAEQVLVRSSKVMGHGRLELHDMVVVDYHRFDRARSRDVAAEVAWFNAQLLEEEAPYLLLGVGRWGSTDPWLGIPVSWDEISGARVIIEAGLKDIRVTPSQGSHFFQNLASFQVGYFTVNPEVGDGVVDWDWISARPARRERGLVRHIRLERPLVVKMNGRRGEGLVLKPAAGGARP
jgi:hypothetical protein